MLYNKIIFREKNIRKSKDKKSTKANHFRYFRLVIFELVAKNSQLPIFIGSKNTTSNVESYVPTLLEAPYLPERVCISCYKSYVLSNDGKVDTKQVAKNKTAGFFLAPMLVLSTLLSVVPIVLIGLVDRLEVKVVDRLHEHSKTRPSSLGFRIVKSLLALLMLPSMAIELLRIVCSFLVRAFALILACFVSFLEMVSRRLRGDDKQRYSIGDVFSHAFDARMPALAVLLQSLGGFEAIHHYGEEMPSGEDIERMVVGRGARQRRKGVRQQVLENNRKKMDDASVLNPNERDASTPRSLATGGTPVYSAPGRSNDGCHDGISTSSASFDSSPYGSVYFAHSHTLDRSWGDDVDLENHEQKRKNHEQKSGPRRARDQSLTFNSGPVTEKDLKDADAILKRMTELWIEDQRREKKANPTME